MATAFAMSSTPSQGSNHQQEFKGNSLDARGNRYQSLNSTIPTAAEAARSVGVEPPLEASSKTWKRAWVVHRTALPYLHQFDKLAPLDSSLCLICLWWKALSGNDPSSPVYDERLHFDMLPSTTRRILTVTRRRGYPRLHHANVEIRTAYLNRAVQRAADQVQQDASTTTPPPKKKKIRLISMGAGYDLRSVRFRLAGHIDEAFELDLPEVVDAKQRLLTQRLLKRRPELTADLLPTMYPVNLNNVSQFESTLRDIFVQDQDDDWHTIFLFEAVMIYLNEGIPTSLLQICRRVLENDETGGTLCFADRLENIPGADLDMAQSVLPATGWEIVEWQPKPGLARHMGMLQPLSLDQPSR